MISDDTFVFENHIQTLTNKALDAGTSVDAAIVWGAQRQTFNPNNNLAGINVGAHPSQPSIPINGDLFYNSTENDLQGHSNGVFESLTKSLFMVSHEDDPAANDDFFVMNGGPEAGGGTELTRQSPIAHDALLQDVMVQINANAEAGISVWTIRINGADGNQTINIPAASSGQFQDLVNTDAVTSGDLLCYQITALTGAAYDVGGSSTVVELT